MSLFPLVVFGCESKPFIRQTYVRLILLTCTAQEKNGFISKHRLVLIIYGEINIVIEANLILWYLELAVTYLNPSTKDIKLTI